MQDLIEYRPGWIARGGVGHREKIVQIGGAATAVLVRCTGPVDHADNERGAPCWTPLTQRLVAAGPGGAEGVQRSPGGPADDREPFGHLPATGEIDDDHRLSSSDRGMHELEGGRCRARAWGAGAQHPSRRLLP